MNSKECKKIIDTILKKQVSNLKYQEIDISYSKKGLEIFEQSEQIALIEVKYLSGNHLPYGALVSITISTTLIRGKIWDIMNKLNLSFRKNGIYHDYIFNQFSSNLRNFAIFKNHGVVSIYPGDDIEGKVLELFEGIKYHFLEKVINAITVNSSLIEDIFTSHERYAYPLTTILIACYLNNCEETDIMTQKSKKLKLSDAKQNKINEIIEKIQLLKD